MALSLQMPVQKAHLPDVKVRSAFHNISRSDLDALHNPSHLEL